MKLKSSQGEDSHLSLKDLLDFGDVSLRQSSRAVWLSSMGPVPDHATNKESPV